MLSFVLFAVFALDRLLKHLAVTTFFRRSPPSAPDPWPSVTLIQPITRSPNDLQAVLRARTQLAYPGAVQQVLVCDAGDSETLSLDSETLALVEQVQREFPGWGTECLRVQQPGYAIATKSFKMNAGLSVATGEVICFVDDDILLPPTALQTLVGHLALPGVGAVFGLACYTNWRTPWAALMSAFVNANALLTYIPFTFLIEPFTITGHCFALRRQTLAAAGGMADLQERLDDDHELARRMRGQGLRLCQTPLVYGVDNVLASWHAYQGQMKRWFAFPRQQLLPYLSRKEQLASLLSTVTNLIPGILAVCAVLSLQWEVWLALLGCLTVFSWVYALEERQFLPYRTPLYRWPLVLVTALLTPFQVLWALFAGDDIEWRGQRLRLKRGGRFERL